MFDTGDFKSPPNSLTKERFAAFLAFIDVVQSNPILTWQGHEGLGDK